MDLKPDNQLIFKP